MMEMEDPGSTGHSFECADVDGGSEPDEEEVFGVSRAKSRHMLYLEKLKSHHDMCEQRYEAAQAERDKKERKRTMVLHRQQDTALDREALGSVTEDSSFEFSDDDYVPPSGATSSDSSLVVEQERKRKVQKRHSDQKASVLRKKKHLLPAKESGSSSTDDDAADVKRQKKMSKRKVQKRSSDQAEEVTVRRKKRCPQTSKESRPSSDSSVRAMTSKKKHDGSRLHNKTFYCPFCSKPHRKMVRHLKSKHKDKPEVARAVAFPKGSKERRIRLALLRNRGTRIHIGDILKQGKEIMIPRQQPTTDADEDGDQMAASASFSTHSRPSSSSRPSTSFRPWTSTPLSNKSSERERSSSGKDSAPPAQGSTQGRKKWSEVEVQAVEKTLKNFITLRKVPGKADCVNCLEESPQALQERSWTAIKFYVKNRIDAAKRG